MKLSIPVPNHPRTRNNEITKNRCSDCLKMHDLYEIRNLNKSYVFNEFFWVQSQSDCEIIEGSLNILPVNSLSMFTMISEHHVKITIFIHYL